MKFLHWCKDGGPESTVYCFTLIEIKSLFSIMLLNFRGKSREAFHSHAFNAISWLLKGELIEHRASKFCYELTDIVHYPSLWPIFTPRSRFHKVDAAPNTWAISFRGPWVKNWVDMEESTGVVKTLTHGRREVAQ
jgi:hypothetical protein